VADGASANAVPAIACQDGVVRRATARRLTAHASCRRVKTSRFAADVATAFAAAVIVTSGTIFDIPDNTVRSVP